MNLKGKTVLVSGAKRGIGYAIVKALLNKGVTWIYAGARDTRKLPNFGDERDEVDIFPDEFEQMLEVWKQDYPDLERMVVDMHNAA
jgi:NAD(P)-dependent dehydrogenase (short-subunit alcohol dehydrogenase family)